ncbi:MAG: DUF3656 domain-containing protein [Planctomycetota bacterium]
MSDASENFEIKKPELMSPAGYWPQLEAAVACGADAVYFGLNHFSARAKVGFGLEELDETIGYLHRHAVKGFVTFNTLVFDHEMSLAEDAILAIAESGADAIIVQDIGVAKLARNLVPDLEVHGSTQMSITSAEGAELAASLGCNRVVLGRELSLTDIRRISKATNVELEVFVHGALCVSYSGQCFSSEAWGGRSANRGQCAQACRLSYELLVDDAKKDLGEYRYLLSPGDLYALEQIPELIDIGIDCFKIEGRYKDAEYVAMTTKAYRDAIDRVFDERVKQSITFDELTQVYSRGLGPHFIAGANHQTVVEARIPRHRGLKVGVVTDVKTRSVIVAADHQVRAGDGVVFDSTAWRSPDEPEEGGNIFSVIPVSPQDCELQFGHGEIDFSRIQIGDPLYRTNDPRLNKKARKLVKKQHRTTGICFEVKAVEGQPLKILATTDHDESATFVGSENLAAAKSRALNKDLLVEQFSRLGGTPFHFRKVDWVMDQPVFCPISLLNEARRALVEQLLLTRKPTAKQIASTRQFEVGDSHETLIEPGAVQLHLLVRSADQLDAAIESRPASITLDYLELYGLRSSVEKILGSGIVARVASPRILKPSEQKIVRFLLSLKCEILVRSGGLFQGLMEQPTLQAKLHGDFSLNAANTVSTATYLNMGLDRVTPTYDLNAQQISELAKTIDPCRLEVVVFHHLPVFHTEHCVFCRFLSNGTNHTNCGHPCEKHRIAIKDSRGFKHAVMADVGCRNTVFGAEAQSGVNHLNQWLDKGLRHFRIEFVHQNSDQVREVTRAFSEFVAQKIDANKLRQRLQKWTDQGTTEGSLFVPNEYKQLVQLGRGKST